MRDGACRVSLISLPRPASASPGRLTASTELPSDRYVNGAATTPPSMDWARSPSQLAKRSTRFSTVRDTVVETIERRGWIGVASCSAARAIDPSA
ncbi:MAG: hypothetical protein CMQ24_08415 [Gammaproteobacteria bacterium]|nr:hypothetical protein [Gammaproteobacteria bacterium]